jgi:hypothetical protein
VLNVKRLGVVVDGGGGDIKFDVSAVLGIHGKPCSDTAPEKIQRDTVPQR